MAFRSSMVSYPGTSRPTDGGRSDGRLTFATSGRVRDRQQQLGACSPNSLRADVTLRAHFTHLSTDSDYCKRIPSSPLHRSTLHKGSRTDDSIPPLVISCCVAYHIISCVSTRLSLAGRRASAPVGGLLRQSAGRLHYSSTPPHRTHG